MKRARIIVIATCLLAAFLILTPATRMSKVEMVLQTVSLTNTAKGLVSVATFRVSNTGSKPARIMFDQVASSEVPVSQHMPAAVAVYGECTVPPGAHCTANINATLTPNSWRVHASVFEPASPARKVRLAAGRLWLTLLGKPGFRPFWAPNLHQLAYRLLSPEVPGANQLMLSPDAASWPAQPRSLYSAGPIVIKYNVPSMLANAPPAL